MKEKEKKSIITKIVTFMLMLCMVFTLIPSTTYAATVRMKNTNPEVYVGKTVQLKLLGTSKKAKWVSGNTSIATVNSNGLVKAKKPGSVVIRATVGNKIAKARVLVNKPKLNKYAVSLDKGETFTLKLIGATAKKWISSDPKVAKVTAAGKVTALSAGKTTITCINTSGVDRMCSVTVKDIDATMKAEYKKILEPFMKEYNFEYLVNATPVTDGNVKCSWNAEAYPLYRLPNNDDMVKTLKDIVFSFEPNRHPDAYIYTWIEQMTPEDNKAIDNDDPYNIPYCYKLFVSYTKGPTSLSFNHTTFQTGETSGIMRVVNIVPNSKYEWSSSDDSVVSLTQDVTTTNIWGQKLTDPIAVHIHANKEGTATITCKVTYPGGETMVCTSEIYVSDTIVEKNLPYSIYNDTLNMDEVMNAVEPELGNRQLYDTTTQSFNIGMDVGIDWGTRSFEWQSFYNYCNKYDYGLGNIKYDTYYKRLNEYVIANAPYYSSSNLEFQGYNDEGIQFGTYGCYLSGYCLSYDYVFLGKK